MSEHPQTIQIFLPSGDPQGIRTAAITTRIVQVIEIPRVRLESFLAMPEAGFVGVYVLFGENEQTSAPMAYVGQTGNLGTRLKQHNEKKDFWNRASCGVIFDAEPDADARLLFGMVVNHSGRESATL